MVCVFVWETRRQYVNHVAHWLARSHLEITILLKHNSANSDSCILGKEKPLR